MPLPHLILSTANTTVRTDILEKEKRGAAAAAIIFHHKADDDGRTDPQALLTCVWLLSWELAPFSLSLSLSPSKGGGGRWDASATCENGVIRMLLYNDGV